MKPTSLLILFAVGLPAPVLATERETVDTEPFDDLFDLAIEKPGGLAHDGKLLWVTDRVAGLLRGLDPATGAPRAELVAPGPWPTGLAYDGKLLWVADKQRARLFRGILRSRW